MLVWFAALAVLGIAQIIRHPSVLVAVNPVVCSDFLFITDGMDF